MGGYVFPTNNIKKAANKLKEVQDTNGHNEARNHELETLIKALKALDSPSYFNKHSGMLLSLSQLSVDDSKGTNKHEIDGFSLFWTGEDLRVLLVEAKQKKQVVLAKQKNNFAIQ